MGSSTKKKNDKKKDFQKPKLKVGKARPKAANFTDTSFKSKGIILKGQSLTATAPSKLSQFSHHLSLLTSRSDSQRKDSLIYLSTAIASRPVDAPLQQPSGVLLAKLLPLVLDGNDNVRIQLARALKTFRAAEVEDFAERILLYVRAGMTHLAAGIRNSSMDVLAWALDLIGDKLVSCPGGWIKTLKYFTVMLGWPSETGETSTTKVAFGNSADETKALVKILYNLNAYIAAGLIDHGESEEIRHEIWTFPLPNAQHHLLPTRSKAYGYLNLFGARRDEAGEMYQEREERQHVFNKNLQAAFSRGLAATKRKGGEVGRAAASAEKTMTEAMGGFEPANL